MDDVQAPQKGTKGTVRGVDDTGSLLVDWDNGSGLNVIYRIDKVKKLDTVKTICYGKETVWDSRDEAIAFYYNAMLNCDGSERERYRTIYTAMAAGESICSDETNKNNIKI